MYGYVAGAYSEHYIDFTKVENVNVSSDFDGCQGYYSTAAVYGYTELDVPSATDFSYTGDYTADLTFHVAEGTVMDEIFHTFPFVPFLEP